MFESVIRAAVALFTWRQESEIPDQLSDETLSLAAKYFSTGLVVADGTKRCATSDLISLVGKASCSGLCQSSAHARGLLQYVGNDSTRVNAAVDEHLKHGLLSACPGCTECYLGFVEVLEHHRALLGARDTDDVASLKEAARNRAAVLHRLGFSLA